MGGAEWNCIEQHCWVGIGHGCCGEQNQSWGRRERHEGGCAALRMGGIEEATAGLGTGHRAAFLQL